MVVTYVLVRIDSVKATQAAPLIASPTMIVALLSPEVREATSTHSHSDIRIELNC